MKQMKFTGSTNEYFEIIHVDENNNSLLNKTKDGEMTLIWFDEPSKMIIDSQSLDFKKNELICLTPLHRVNVASIKKARVLRFNAPFYCILNHDSEVGCKGVLFYGSRNIPIIRLSLEELEILSAVWKMLELEMTSRDTLQLEMLQMMLKRILILCTRIYKSQENLQDMPKDQIDIVREFNFLVEQHFKEKHSVSEYADLLNKSPKTLANLFGKTQEKTPLQVIQNRIMVEVRRLLRYTEIPISEVGYEVGFQDIQSFSRFFKKNEGIPPSEFRMAP